MCCKAHLLSEDPLADPVLGQFFLHLPGEFEGVHLAVHVHLVLLRGQRRDGGPQGSGDVGGVVRHPSSSAGRLSADRRVRLHLDLQRPSQHRLVLRGGRFLAIHGTVSVLHPWPGTRHGRMSRGRRGGERRRHGGEGVSGAAHAHHDRAALGGPVLVEIRTGLADLRLHLADDVLDEGGGGQDAQGHLRAAGGIGHTLFLFDEGRRGGRLSLGEVL